jgi:predicted ATPase
MADIYAACVTLLRGDLNEAQQLAEQGTHLATRQGSLMYITMGRVVQGCLAVRGADCETGLNILKKALPDYRATSAQIFLPVFLSFLAEALSRCGKIEEAFATIAEALRLTATGLEVFWEAELYRLKGELTLQQERQKAKGKIPKAKVLHPQSHIPDPQSEAEACFHQAIEIARRQEAKSLELRAVMSLVRLRQQQAAQSETRNTEHGARPMQHATRNTLEEARRQVSAIYHWFTEGFDTKDLQEARALLNELG